MRFSCPFSLFSTSAASHLNPVEQSEESTFGSSSATPVAAASDDGSNCGQTSSGGTAYPQLAAAAAASEFPPFAPSMSPDSYGTNSVPLSSASYPLHHSPLPALPDQTSSSRKKQRLKAIGAFGSKGKSDASSSPKGRRGRPRRKQTQLQQQQQQPVPLLLDPDAAVVPIDSCCQSEYDMLRESETDTHAEKCFRSENTGSSREDGNGMNELNGGGANSPGEGSRCGAAGQLFSDYNSFTSLSSNSASFGLGTAAASILSKKYLSHSSPTGSTGQSGGLSSSGRTKRMRTSFKHHQLKKMKSYFTMNHNPDSKALKELSIETGLSKRVLQVG